MAQSPALLSRLRLLAALASALVARPAAAAGVDATRISLPKGPGSVEGLASTNLEPSLASGGSAYSVKIVVPPAAGGFGPALALAYDSGGGASELGIGWRVAGAPKLIRRTEDGLPRFDETDTFQLVGLGAPCELLEVEPGLFRPRFEDGSFVRLSRGEDGARWEARTRGGITFRFGGAGRTEAEGARVSSYLLAEQLDTHGRRISYEWDTAGGYALLTRVVWNDHDAASRNEVRFSHEERPDVHVRFSSGIRQEIGKRLASIEVLHGGALVRRYDLAYGEGTHPPLVGVELVGRDGQGRMPSARFGYSSLRLFAGAPALVTMEGAPGRSPGAPDTALSDVNGDGLPDLLVATAGAYRYHPNHDGKRWLPPVEFGPAASPSVSLSARGVQLADMDADGASDVLVKTTTSARYFPSPSDGGFGGAVALASVPSFSFEDPDVRLADMDGDRRTDIVVTTEAGLAIGYNRDGRDLATPSFVGAVDVRAPLRFSDGRTELCDVNGDRVMDLCVLRPASLVYYLGRGRGTFEPAATAFGVPTYDEAAPYRLVDLDGDGWLDLLRPEATRTSFALAEGLGRFGAEQTLTGTPGWAEGTTLELADMNASGTVDLVWVNTTAAATPSFRYLELFPAGRAGLLTRIENGLGKVQSIEYEPAASHAARARDAGEPWRTRLNVPLPVVTRVTIDSSLGGPVQELRYAYGGGAYDSRERTVAGFSLALVQEVGDAFTPTLVTERTFDLGLDHRVLRGAPLTEERRDLEGRVFTRTLHEHTRRTLATAADGRTVVHAFASAVTTTHVEGGAVAPRTTRIETEQDDFGNVIEERRWGEVVGEDLLAGSDETIVMRTFANDPVEWLLGFIATEETVDATGNRVSFTRRHYDGEAFTGLPLGEVSRGAVTREEAWVGPDQDAFELVNSTRYDADGLPIETRDGRGGGRLFTWASDRTTLVSEEVKLGGGAPLIEVAETDPATGALLSVIDHAGERTRFTYDAFGRLTTLVRPGDRPDLPTVSYRYEVGSPLSRIVTETRRLSGEEAVDVSETLQDGLGRTRATLTRDGERTVLAGVALLDARGNPRRILSPRLVDPAAHADPLPLLSEDHPRGVDSWRDALGREVRTRSAGGIESSTTYLPLQKEQRDGGRSDPAAPYTRSPDIEHVDGQGRVVAHVRHLGNQAVTARQGYDAAGAMLWRTDPEGNTATYKYDGRGRRIAVHDPDAGVTRLEFDSTDNVTARTYPDGVTARFTFDLAGRSLTEDWNGDGAPEVAHAYDLCEDDRATPLCRGKLVRTYEPSGSVGHDYDARGRVLRTHYTIDGKTHTVGSEYDAQDRERLHIYPDGSSLALHRNARGQLSGYGNDLLTFGYDDDGLELSRRFGTGVTLTTGYDTERRRAVLSMTSAAGAVIEALRFTYDSAGNLTQLTDERRGLPPGESRSETYTHDDLYRLTGATGTWGTTSFRFSPSGKLLARQSTVPGQTLGSITYEDRPHAPTAFDDRRVSYDARGRMLDDGRRTYEWNDADQLSSVTGPDGASSVSRYGADGVRRSRTETRADGTTSTTHFIDAWAEERDGVLVRYIVHGGQRIVRLSGETGTAGASRSSPRSAW